MSEISDLHRIEPAELDEFAVRFEQSTPEEILAWGLRRFHPRLALACSFGPEDVALVDIMVRVQPDARVFYLDTDFLFPETHDVRLRIIERYGIEPLAVRPPLSPDEQARLHGEELYKRHPDQCCKIRKVDPLRQTLQGLDAWITGIRRQQSPTRANTRVIEWDAVFGLVKINPLALWKDTDVWDYIRRHDVPYNILHDQNYPSVGCTHCTLPVQPGQDPRSGRWAGSAKTECGLHLSTAAGGPQ